MAEQGRREVVPDQLAFNAREQAPERSLATIGVRSPGQTGGPTRSASRAMEGLFGALGGMADAVNDDMITTGKLNFMRGMSEQEAYATGNQFTQQGWQALGSVDKANTWFLQEQEALMPGGQAEAMDPEAYQKYLMDRRSKQLELLPNDPAVRKLYVAAFEDKGPQLVAKQYEAHMAYNQGKAINEFSNVLSSGSVANADASRVMPGSTLRVSPSRVDTAIMGSGGDREAGILTMLGEAGGEGDVGMAAVAHVIKNRVTDNRWGGSVDSVVKAKSQFSVWNDGGGNLAKYRGTPAYERAGQIYDAVMGGFTNDMTNGATHYYSPAGMQKLVSSGAQGNLEPGWLATETQRSGGGIKIGGHIFAGKSGMAGYIPLDQQAVDEQGQPAMPGARGVLNFQHKDQTNIKAGFAGILQESSAALGLPFTILSGHRDADHPVEAAKASGPGEHTEGDAVDISMKGMSDEQRRNLVADLRSRGVTRFIAYSKYPDMLHVDMNSKGGTTDANGNWFMFDKSAKNMGSAPQWFQQIAQSDTGKPLPKGDQSQIRSLVQNYQGLSPQMKASTIADTMRRQLDSGSDQLFNDAGGVGILYELGAKPSEIDEVIKAKERQEKKQLDGYDTGFERERSDLMSRVKNGDFSSADDIISAVDQMYSSKRMNGSQAQSLVRSAQSEWEKVRQGDDAVLPKGFMEDVTSVYRKVDGGLLTSSEAYDQIAEMGKSYNIDPKTSQRFLQKVYSTADAAYARDRSEAETLRKKKEADDKIKSKATMVLAKDAGKANMPDGSVDDNGTKKTATEFAIDELKGSIRDTLQQGIQSGKIDETNATQLLYTNLYTKLARNDIVDERGSAAFQASLRVGVMDPVTKQVRPAAKEAVGTYINLTNNPDISAGYVARMFSDDKVRGYLEQTKALYEQNLDLDTAMMKAEELIANGNDPKNITHNYYTQVDNKIDEAIKHAAGTDTFFAKWLPRFPAITNVSNAYETSLLTTERNKAATYIRARADAMNSLQPGQDPEVSIKLAMDAFANDAVQVRGQFLIGDHRKGLRIDQKMFVNDNKEPMNFPKSAVQDSMNYAIEKYGKTWWPEFYGKGDDSARPMQGAPSLAPVNITYNPNSGVVGFQFHGSKGEPKGRTIFVDAKDLGDDYRKAYLENPGTFGKMFDGAMDSIAGGIQRDQGTQAGAEIGAMVGGTKKPAVKPGEPGMLSKAIDASFGAVR